MSTKKYLEIASVAIVVFFSIYLFLYSKDDDSQRDAIEIRKIASLETNEQLDIKELDTIEIINGDKTNTLVGEEKITLSQYISLLDKKIETPVFNRNKNTESYLEEKNRIITNLRAYGNTAGEIVRKNLISGASQIEAFEAFFKNSMNNGSQFEMGKIADSYNKIASDMSLIKPPKEIAYSHNTLTEELNKTGDAVRTLFMEITKGGDQIAEVEKYNNSISTFSDAYLNVASTLRAFEVKFDKSEPGSVFTLPI